MLGLRGEVLKLGPAGLKQSHFLIPASLRSSAHTQGRGPLRAIAALGHQRLASLCRGQDSRLRGNDACEVSAVIPAKAGIQEMCACQCAGRREHDSAPTLKTTRTRPQAVLIPKPLCTRRGAQRRADQEARLSEPRRGEFERFPARREHRRLPRSAVGAQGTRTVGSPFLGYLLWRDKEGNSAAGPRPGLPRTLQNQRQRALPTEPTLQRTH